MNTNIYRKMNMSNTGNYNTGDCNSGDYNSGDYNTGDYNSGDYNSGDWNSGDYNSGNHNTGDWNSGDYNSGCFNTVETPIMFFNKPSKMTYQEWMNSEARFLLYDIPKNTVAWIESTDMTDEEKFAHPEYKTTGGFLKNVDTDESRQMWWNGLTDKKKEIIKAIPNFDEKIFEEITGINVCNIRDIRITKEEVAKSVALLDLFTKTFCRYEHDHQRLNDLRFRCEECPFQKENGDCLLKLFKNKYAPDYRDFGSMGDL